MPPGQGVDLILRMQGETTQLQGELEKLRARLGQLKVALAGTAAEEPLAALEEAAGRIDTDLADVQSALRGTTGELSSLTFAAQKFEDSEKNVRKLASAVAVTEEGMRRFRRTQDDTTEAFEEQGEEGTKAARKIDAAYAAFFETVKRGGDGASAAVDKLGSGSRGIGRLLEAADTEAKRLVVSLADIEARTRQTAAASAEGLGAFGKQAASTRARIAEVKATLDEMKDETVVEFRAELVRLEQQFDKMFDRGVVGAKAAEEAIDEAGDEARRLRTELDQAERGSLSLSEALFASMPKTAKAIGGAVSAVAAFKVAFQETREVIKFFKDTFGIDIDAFVQGMAVATGAVALTEAAIAKLRGQELAEAEAVINVARARETLIKRGLEFEDTQEGILASYRKLLAAEEEQRLALREQAFAWIGVRDAMLGVPHGELEKALGTITGAINFLKDDQALLTTELRDKLNKELVELLNRSKEAGNAINQGLVVDLVKAARAVGLATTEIEAGAQRVRSLDRELSGAALGVRNLTSVTSGGAEEMVSSIEEVLAQIERLGPVQAREAAKIRTELQGLRAEYQRVGEVASIREATADVRRLAEEMAGAAGGARQLGQVTPEAAQRVVDSVDDILERIQELPAGQRAAVEGSVAELETLRAAYYGLSSDFIKSQEEAAAKVKALYMGLADSIRGTLDQINQAVRPPSGGGDIAQQIKARQEEISAIEQQQDLGSATIDQVNRLAEAQDELSDLQGNFRAETGATYEEWSEGLTEVNQGQAQAADLLQDLVTGNEAFRDGVAALEPAARDAIGNMIGHLEVLAQQQNLTSQDVDSFGRRVEEVFASAGVSVEGLGVAAGASAQSASQAFEQIAAEGESSFDRVGEAAADAEEAQRGPVDEARALQKELKTLGEEGPGHVAALTTSLDPLLVKLTETLAVCRQLSACVREAVGA